MSVTGRLFQWRSVFAILALVFLPYAGGIAEQPVEGNHDRIERAFRSLARAAGDTEQGYRIQAGATPAHGPIHLEVESGGRYTIVYNSEFFARTIPGPSWTPVAAFYFLHELGHRVLLHRRPVNTVEEFRDQEEEADEYAVTMLVFLNPADWDSIAPAIGESLLSFANPDTESEVQARLTRLGRVAVEARQVASALGELRRSMDTFVATLNERGRCGPTVNCLFAITNLPYPKHPAFIGSIFWKPDGNNMYLHKDGRIFALEGGQIRYMSKRYSIDSAPGVWKFALHRHGQEFLVDRRGQICPLPSGPMLCDPRSVRGKFSQM